MSYLKRVCHNWWLETFIAEAAAMVQALRRDLRALEDDARALAAELEDATDWNPGQGSLQQLEGRFLCLAGMYKAHSQVCIPGRAHGSEGVSSLAHWPQPATVGVCSPCWPPAAGFLSCTMLSVLVCVSAVSATYKFCPCPAKPLTCSAAIDSTEIPLHA